MITGYKGFIGEHLFRRLSSNGHELFGIDRHDGFFHNLVFDDNIANAFKRSNPDIIIHLASNISNDPFSCLEDIKIIIRLLDKSLAYKVKKFVFISSAAIYGDSFPDLKPINAYGISKLQCEQWCNHFSKLGLSIAILRLSNVYGPKGSGVINQFINNLKNGEPLIMNSHGKHIRDFIHIDDIIDAIAKSIDLTGIFNVSTGKGHSVMDIVNIFKGINKNIGVQMRNIDDDGVIHISIIKRSSEFQIKKSLKESIEELCKA